MVVAPLPIGLGVAAPRTDRDSICYRIRRRRNRVAGTKRSIHSKQLHVA